MIDLNIVLSPWHGVMRMANLSHLIGCMWCSIGLRRFVFRLGNLIVTKVHLPGKWFETTKWAITAKLLCWFQKQKNNSSNERLEYIPNSLFSKKRNITLHHLTKRWIFYDQKKWQFWGENMLRQHTEIVKLQKLYK